MALEYEGRKACKDHSISKNDAETTPVLLLEKVGERQYFFVPGGFDAKLHAQCFKQLEKRR